MLGSLPLLYLLSLAFIVASLALGLLMSTLVRSQVQAMQLSFLFLLPNILLSGFMFPRQAMPAPAQWIGAALPLTYFLDDPPRACSSRAPGSPSSGRRRSRSWPSPWGWWS